MGGGLTPVGKVLGGGRMAGAKALGCVCVCVRESRRRGCYGWRGDGGEEGMRGEVNKCQRG